MEIEVLKEMVKNFNGEFNGFWIFKKKFKKIIKMQKLN